MKTLRFISIIALMALVSCSANHQTAKDETYYSPYGNPTAQMTRGNGSYVSPSISSNSEYDYQAYYSDSKNYVNNPDPVYQTTETVTDTNGVVYTTTETYYDADYATRIKRFGTQASSSRDYYDDYYTYGGGNTYVYMNSYDPFYWDYYPTNYYGWSYRPYWSSYWSANWYWGFSYNYSYYWGWDPYWSYGWNHHHHYWHHPHHYPYHGDWHHGGGHHNGGFGNGGSNFSKYVASVRHGSPTGSMSHALPNNRFIGNSNIGSMSTRPQSNTSASLAHFGYNSSSTRRPTMSSRPTIGSGATPQRPAKKEIARPGSQSGERQNYTSPNTSRPSRSSSEYVRPNSSSSRPSSSDSSRRSSNSGYNRNSNSSSSSGSFNRSNSSPSRSSSSSSSRSSSSSFGGGSRGSSSSSSSHSSSSSSHSSSSGSRGGGGGRR